MEKSAVTYNLDISYNRLKNQLVGSFVYEFVRSLRRILNHIFKKDRVSGIQKSRVLRRLAKEHNLKNLIETGAFVGDTIASLKSDFSSMYSIELSTKYASHCRKRFSRYPHIFIKEGDSTTELKNLLLHEHKPTLFWLDGHYSGGDTAKGNLDSPIIDELKSILSQNRRGDVICIDDADFFNGENGYPTIDQLNQIVSEYSKGNMQLGMCETIIVITDKN